MIRRCLRLSQCVQILIGGTVVRGPVRGKSASTRLARASGLAGTLSWQTPNFCSVTLGFNMHSPLLSFPFAYSYVIEECRSILAPKKE